MTPRTITNARTIIWSLVVLIGLSKVGLAEEKRPITPGDCVTVRYPLGELKAVPDYQHPPVQVSPQQTSVAYILKSPDLAANRNDMQLFVKSMSAASPRAKLVATGSMMSHVQWLKDGIHLVVLMKEINGAFQGIYKVDTETGTSEPLFHVDGEVTTYSIDENEDTVAVALTEKPSIITTTDGVPSEADLAKGYLVPYLQQDMANHKQPGGEEILIANRIGDNDWGRPRKIAVTSPDGKQQISSMAWPWLSISPNGKQLLVSYYWDAESLSGEWRKSPFVVESQRRGSLIIVPLIMYDIATQRSIVALKTPRTLSIPVWSRDSKSFTVNAAPPVGSVHDTANMANAEVIWVEPASGRIESITKLSLDNRFNPPLFWGGEKNELLVQNKTGTISGYIYERGGWEEVEEIQIPHPDTRRATIYPISDGVHILATYMDVTTPPELIEFERGWKDVKVLEKFNPEFERLTIAPVENITWESTTGLRLNGYLFKPANYVEGNRYPLVIQTKEDTGSFVCDSGDEHFPSFAPQPLADAGMMYIVRTIDMDDKSSYDEDINHWPKGYPGAIGEAAADMDIWDQAVDMLDQRGLIDRNKVGIIGFSRSGWYVEFALAHGKTHYAAATTADNLSASLSEYWQSLNRETSYMNWLDTVYGGPPFGKTLKNWIDYSVSFNLDKFHTPLLLERMGNGQKTPFTSQNDRTVFEVFTELNHLKKPVEFYYYPNETHLLNDPVARLASLQRNVDWYRFWLQDYEDPDPAKAAQYKRWEHLREMQAAESKPSAQLPPATAKPN